MNASTRARLGAYLLTLEAWADAGHEFAVSERIGAFAGINATQVRRDLSVTLGTTGRRGHGYPVGRVALALRRELDGDVAGACSVLVAARVERLRAVRSDSRLVAGEVSDPLPWTALERAATAIELIEAKAGSERLLNGRS